MSSKKYTKKKKKGTKKAYKARSRSVPDIKGSGKPPKAEKKFFHYRDPNSRLHKALKVFHTNFVKIEDRKLRHASNGEGSLRTLDSRVFEPFTEESSSVASSLMDPLHVYRFKLGGYTTLSQVAGVMNSFIAADPSASGWNSPEWSTLSSLFSEFKLVSLTVRICRNYNSAVTGNVFNLGICSNLGTAVSPGSYAAVADNADATFYSYTDTARGRDGHSGYVHTMHATGLNWSQVTTPTVEPYAGAPGSIQFFSDNGTASGSNSNVFQILIFGVYDFRVRV